MGKKSDSTKIKNLTKRDILEAAISKELLSKSRKKRQQNSAKSSIKADKKENQTIKKLKDLLKKSQSREKQPPNLKVSKQKILDLKSCYYISYLFLKAMGLQDEDEDEDEDEEDEASDQDSYEDEEDEEDEESDQDSFISGNNSEDQEFDIYDIDSEGLTETGDAKKQKKKTSNKAHQKNASNTTSSTSSTSKRKEPGSSSEGITQQSPIPNEELNTPKKRSRQAVTKVTTYNVSKLQDFQEKKDNLQEPMEEEVEKTVEVTNAEGDGTGVKLPMTAKKVEEGLFDANIDPTREGRETLVPKKFHRTLEEVAKEAEKQMNPAFVPRPSQYTPLSVSGNSSFKTGLLDGGVQSDKMRLWLSFTYKEGTTKATGEKYPYKSCELHKMNNLKQVCYFEIV